MDDSTTARRFREQRTLFHLCPRCGAGMPGMTLVPRRRRDRVPTGAAIALAQRLACMLCQRCAADRMTSWATSGEPTRRAFELATIAERIGGIA